MLSVSSSLVPGCMQSAWFKSQILPVSRTYPPFLAVDPAEKALLIIYEQENQVFDDDGHRVSSIRKQK